MDLAPLLLSPLRHYFLNRKGQVSPHCHSPESLNIKQSINWWGINNHKTTYKLSSWDVLGQTHKTEIDMGLNTPQNKYSTTEEKLFVIPNI